MRPVCCQGRTLTPLPNGARIISIPPTPCDHRHNIYRVAGIELPLKQNFGCYFGCLQNELVALHNRHLVRRLEPDSRTVRAVAAHWIEAFPTWRVFVHSTEEQVIANTCQSKRERVRLAFKKYHEEGWLPKDAFIRMFVKHEKGEDDVNKPLEEGDPRAIQYRSFKHTSLFKKVLHPFEHRLWKLGQNLEERAPMRERIFSKCMNPISIAQNLRHGWDQMSDPVADLWDVSRMDAHMHALLRECIEFPTYRKGTHGFEPYLACMRRNKCFSKSGIKYEMEYTMCSGEACTSSGDSIVMAAALYYMYRNVKRHILVCGDDTVVIRERSAQVDDIFTGLGLPVKREEADLFEHVEFCQSRPVSVDGVWRMVRNPDRVLGRGPLCVKTFSGGDKPYRDWLASVGVGELESGAGVPVVQAFATAAMQLGNPRPHFVREYLENKRTCGLRDPTEVSETTRASFWLAWGISPESQRALERLVAEMVVSVEPGR